MHNRLAAFFCRSRVAIVVAAVALFLELVARPGSLRAEETAQAVQSGPSPIRASPSDAVLRPILEHYLARLSSKPLSNWYQPVAGDARVSLKGFQRAIDKARRQGDAAGCLRLSLRSLATHGTGGDFPRRLWEAAGNADWAERKYGPRVVDPGLCSALLSLCDELPSRQAYCLEGRFLRAKRLARAGNRSGEQEILNQVIATPGLPFDFLAPACRMLGDSLEASGDYRGAVDSYDLMEAAADRYSAAADCLLKAALINLRLGNDDEAARLVRILQQAPAEVINGASGAAQIRELVGLIETGQAARLSLVRRDNPIGAQYSARSDPGTAVARWIKSNALGWYDFAGPDSLDASHSRNLDGALRRPDALLKPAEQIKLLLLTAQDPQAPVEKRQDSFREAARRILAAAPDYPRFNAIAASVIDNPDFDQGSRRLTLESALAMLAQEGRKADYERWRGDPLAKTFSAEFQAKLAILDGEAALDRTSSAAILQLADGIRSKPMTTFGALTLGDLLGFLLRLGDLQSAAKLASSVPSWPVDAEAAQRIDAIQSDFARRIQQASDANPMHDALAAALRADYPDAPAGLPAEYRDLRIDSGLPGLGPEATFRACRFLIEQRQFDRDGLQFWGTLLRAIPRNGGRPAIVADLLRSGLREATGDALRSQLIALFFTSVDVDDPEVRRAIEAEFAPFRHPMEFPQSAFAIRFYEVLRDLRLGEPVPLETAFSDLGDPRAGIVQVRLGIRHYTQTGDREALQRTIDRLDTAHLLGADFVGQTIPAYRVLGRDVRVPIEAARRALRDAILDSWLRHDESSGGSALDLALAIGDPAALPSGWVREMSSGAGDPLFQGRVRMVQAYLESDWARVEAEAGALNRAYPSSYRYCWYRGLALHNLGRQAEAAAALTVYAQHARDELEYPKAVEILNSMGLAAPP